MVLTPGALALMVRGIRQSTAVVGGAVVFQVVVMVVIGGLNGLSAGFPLALYMFIGRGNGPALADECRNPRTTVPRALLASIVLTAGLFVLYGYGYGYGYGYDVSSIGRSPITFRTVADQALGPFAVPACVVGVVSVPVTLVSGTNPQSRMVYDGGHTGTGTDLSARRSRELPKGAPRRTVARGGAPSGALRTTWSGQAAAGTTTSLTWELDPV